jgi:peptide/nickel transport system permease protein
MKILFILRKLFRAFLTILVLVTFVFVVLRLSGDPAVSMLGTDVSNDAYELFRKRWGLDLPIWRQYLIYLANITKGDFGPSLMSGGQDALSVILDRLPKTLWLMGLTSLFTFLIGIPLGVYASLRHNSGIDRMIMTVSVASFSVPNFVIGVLLIMLFAVFWKMLPAGGSESPAHYILPVLTMATGDAAIFARFTRSAMVETLGAEYMRTAQAKGLRWALAVRRHAFPNALIPIVTVSGWYLGRNIAAATITENVFAWPGLGRLLVTSVENRDMAVVQAIVMLIGFTLVTANLLVDLSYGWLDPRIRTRNDEK